MRTDSATPGLRLVPSWVRTYDRADLRADLVGGLTTGAVVVPQAIAYASIAHLPAEVGLYSCIVPAVVYALVGGSRTLSMSTTSTVASMTGTALLATSVAGSQPDPTRALATLTVLVGVILVAARLLRLGVLVESISGATLVGVKLSVGLTVAAGQLAALLGLPGDPAAETLFAEIGGVVGDLHNTSLTTVALSISTIAVLLGLRRFAARVPGPLIVVAGAIALVAIVGLDDHGVALISPVPAGLPAPVWPDGALVGPLLPGAAAIALMCFLETATVATASRRRGEPSIDDDEELTANGLSCLAGGVFGSMPAAGGFSQTMTNRSSGARTQLSGLVAASLAVGCALALAGVLSSLPQATLAALVAVAVAGLIRPRDLVRYWRHSRLELWVACTTALAGVVVGLLAAVLVGVVLTFALVLHELDRVGTSELQPTLTGDDVETAGAGTVVEPGLMIVKVDGPLYTGNVRRVSSMIVDAVEAAVESGRAIDTVVLDVGAVPRFTYTVVDRSDELDREVTAHGAELWYAGVADTAVAGAAGTTEWWPEWMAAGRIHPTSLAALRAHRSRGRRS